MDLGLALTQLPLNPPFPLETHSLRQRNPHFLCTPFTLHLIALCFFFTACITNQNYIQYVFALCFFSISRPWNVNSLIHPNTSNRIVCKAGAQQLLFKWMTLSLLSLSKYSPNSCLRWNLAVLWRPYFPWSFLKEKELMPLHTDISQPGSWGQHRVTSPPTSQYDISNTVKWTTHPNGKKPQSFDVYTILYLSL